MTKYMEAYLKAIDNPPIELARAFQAEKQFLEKELGGSKGIVIESGCGAGRTLAAISRTNPLIEFYGIDCDETMIFEALRRTSSLQNVNIKLGNALELPFPNRYAQLSFSTYNLVGELSPDQIRKLLSEQARTTKKSGKVITMMWRTNDQTVDFLGDYYQSLGLSVIQHERNRTMTDKGTFGRIEVSELEEKFRLSGLTQIRSREIGPVWHAVEGIV